MSTRTRLWQPPGDAIALTDAQLRDLAYVVVDERIGAVASLAISDWPRVDAVGRLKYPAGLTPRVVAVPVNELQRYLRDHRQPRRHVDRPVRIGDVYAIGLTADLHARLLADDADDETIVVRPAGDFTDTCFDVSAQAREAAKTAFYGAVAPVVRDADDPVVRLAGKAPPSRA